MRFGVILLSVLAILASTASSAEPAAASKLNTYYQRILKDPQALCLFK